MQISYEDTPVSAPPQEQVAEAARDAEMPPASSIDFAEFAVLPEAGDNCAILRKRLDAGTTIRLFDGTECEMGTTVLAGHRVAVSPIPVGGRLLSWGLAFGVATEHIRAGEYVCNAGMISTLAVRRIEGLPEKGNFEDIIEEYVFDEAAFRPAEQVPLLPAAERLTFRGYDRSGAQGGVGTRNYVAVVPTSALSGPFARRLAASLGPAAKALPNCDGVVAMAHTEAALDAGSERPNNWDLLVRTLSGWVGHANNAATLVVGHEGELLSPEVLRAHMQTAGAPTPALCKFHNLTGSFEDDLAACREVVQGWFPEVNRCERTEQPLSHLRVALQCGGSDAFSGVSGNPASGTAAKILIEHGGAAVLAETDELLGAETYVLDKVRDAGTVKKFLELGHRFKERLSWHYQSAESNPSGGNKLRGLYNIALKSIGAGKKKHADVCLDGCLEYSELLPVGARGYYFLDSPGNDLESTAGQVACGCNLIIFITGNGAITNFPFVPTIKVITTTERHKLLEDDMDFNAGRYQDANVPMADLGRELFEDMVRVASGGRSLGEKAGHSQCSIWREWAQCGPPEPSADLTIADREGMPLELAFGAMSLSEPPAKRIRSTEGGVREADLVAEEVAVVKGAAFLGSGAGTQRIGLVFPTSICSGEVARKSAEDLSSDPALNSLVDKFVALPHTEGCGAGTALDGERLYNRIMLGHLTHANVSLAFLLEHGCEKTHNEYVRDELRKQGVDPEKFGYASAQLDGGNDKARTKVREWFLDASTRCPPSPPVTTPLARIPIAILGEAPSGGAAELSAMLVRAFVGAGGTAFVPSSSLMLRSAFFLDELMEDSGVVRASLAYAQPATRSGAHVMDVPAGVLSRVEVVTGLVSCGAGLVVVVSQGLGRSPPVVGHPLVHVLHVVADEQAFDATDEHPAEAVAGPGSADLVLRARYGEEARERHMRWLLATVGLMAGVASREKTAKASHAVDFQVARGPTGASA